MIMIHGEMSPGGFDDLETNGTATTLRELQRIELVLSQIELRQRRLPIRLLRLRARRLTPKAPALAAMLDAQAELCDLFYRAAVRANLHRPTLRLK